MAHSFKLVDGVWVWQTIGVPPNEKEKLRLHSDHLQSGHQKLGAQRTGLVPCTRSKHHPFHPAHEACGYCDPEEDDLDETTWRCMMRDIDPRFYY